MIFGNGGDICYSSRIVKQGNANIIKITYYKNNRLDVYRILMNRIVVCGPYYLAYASTSWHAGAVPSWYGEEKRL